MKAGLVICAVALGAAAPVMAAAPGSGQARLTHFLCRQAQSPKRRVMSVTAVMRPIPRTQHMQIRFDLLRQPAGASAFKPVYGGDLDRWIGPSDPTLGQRPADVWRLEKVIRGLAGPAVYRMRVSFRWLDAQRRVLGRAVRATSICRAD